MVKNEADAKAYSLRQGISWAQSIVISIAIAVAIIALLFGAVHLSEYFADR